MTPPWDDPRLKHGTESLGFRIARRMQGWQHALWSYVEHPFPMLDEIRCRSAARDLICEGCVRGKGGISSARDFISHLIGLDRLHLKPGNFRALAGPKANLSAVPAALSRSRGALSPAGP